MNTELPSLPWKKVATDLFYGKASLLIELLLTIIPGILT